MNHEELAAALEQKIVEVDELLDQRPKGCVLPNAPCMGIGYFLQDLADWVRTQAPPHFVKIGKDALASLRAESEKGTEKP
jgi:hypothetical protein